MSKKIFAMLFVALFFLTACGQKALEPGQENFDQQVDGSQQTGETLGQALEEDDDALERQAIEDAKLEAEGSNWIAESEVAKHNTVDDCWTIIHDQVFDITPAISNHPGGEAILMGCGINATQLFEERPSNGTPHSDRAHENLDNFYLGDLAR
ncbi:hypothetical protein H6761_03035 [Candidatus Nomurabacteria bacterium]|nr:hypothetical protein [Candidatus Nomurabacteria bacterium]